MTPRPGPPWQAGDAHVFVDDLDQPRLGPDDRHHLGSVLRLRAGQAVTVSDGAGRWRPCRITQDQTGRRHGEMKIEPDGPIIVEAAPAYPVTVAFALTKRERPEWAVQRLSEAGVDNIIVFNARHSVARWDEAKASRQMDRLGKVARAAAMQSRRTRLVRLAGPVSFDEMTKMLDSGPEGVVLPDPAGSPPDSAASLRAGRASVALAQVGGPPPRAGLAGVAIGPEGGWSEEELGAGLDLVGLGPAVYRAEMAAVAAGVLLSALRSGLVSPGVDRPDRGSS